MFKFKQKGNYSKINRYLTKVQKPIKLDMLKKYGDEGVDALKANTPFDSGKTRESWYYKIIIKDGSARIEYCNSHINKNVSIAIILQYGHGTGTGGWVQGRDYINPAIQPVFDKMAKSAWEEIIKL